MNKRAWYYIGIVYSLGLISIVASFVTLSSIAFEPQAFFVFTLLAVVTQLIDAEAPHHQLYSPHLVFFFAGLILLPLPVYMGLIVVSHLVEWIHKRLTDSPNLRVWYIQPFNIATFSIAGFAAALLYRTLQADTTVFWSNTAIVAVAIAALAFVLTNHVLVGAALVLARGVSWKDSGALDRNNLQSDLFLLLMGYLTAVVWTVNPWLVAIAVLPLVLIQRALMIPQLMRDAQTDSKTSLWNASHFTKLVEAELERAERFNHPMGLIVVDLDHFKLCNDTYGHLAGDVVLQAVAGIIRTNLREYDIAGRFGGEEFVVALIETDPEEALRSAERLRQAIEAARIEVRTSVTPIQVTASLGLACFPTNGVTLEDLTHSADEALYQAKAQGRNRVVCASEVLVSKS
ncbi:MAG: diguanylate cyclase [Chloroflexaceae bacterium]|jgi:diguanylate cyclase (GGDEF)-like protein|nr:diguanylate cyclase [Chloroflexaceae bacterium]